MSKKINGFTASFVPKNHYCRKCSGGKAPIGTVTIDTEGNRIGTVHAFSKHAFPGKIKDVDDNE